MRSAPTRRHAATDAAKVCSASGSANFDVIKQQKYLQGQILSLETAMAVKMTSHRKNGPRC